MNEMLQVKLRKRPDCGVCGVPADVLVEVTHDGYMVPRCADHGEERPYQAESRLAQYQDVEWYDWNNPRQAKAERRALRRTKWRAFWRGVFMLGPDFDTARFWEDVRRFGGREPAPRMTSPPSLETDSSSPPAEVRSGE